MKEAVLYQKLEDQVVRCHVCQRRCHILPEKVGFCRSRLNQNGRLYSLLYGITNNPIQVDPIEKKPFYHFKPGSLVASIGSFGCNFRCKQCLNWWCSWGEPATTNLKSQSANRRTNLKSGILPKEIIKTIVETGYQGIAFTYNEPVIWAELVYDLVVLAKKTKIGISGQGLVTKDQWPVNNRSPITSRRSQIGLYTVFVTNGSWTKETLDYLGPYLDATNIDFKGFSEKTYIKQGAFFGQIPQMAKYAQEKYKIHLEITTLLIPGINDNPKELKKMAEWITKNLGPDTPWHLSQFDPKASPDKEFQKIPFTSVEQLKKAAEIGEKAGLNHVYIWAPNSRYSRGNLICPKCKRIVLKRLSWQPVETKISQDRKCLFCGYKLRVVL